MSTEGKVYPYRLESGLWVVRMGSAQYRAWAFWLNVAFGKRSFPQPVMVVWGELPPTTNEGAAAVAAQLAAMRKEIKWHKPGNLWPEPWDGYIPPPDEPGKSPLELRPWHELADPSKPGVAPYLADELDRLQGRTPPPRQPKRGNRPLSLRDLPPAPVSQAVKDKVRKELGFPPDAKT